MHRAIKPGPHHLRYAARIVAVGLVDLRPQHRPHMSRLNTDHWQARFGENAVKPLRQRSSFQPNSLEAIDGVRQNLQESFRLTRHLRFPHDLARIIHDADARLLDRHIESSKIVHAALLLLMLEAVFTDLVFTISPKHSTQNLQLSTSWQADYPIFRGKSGRAVDISAMTEFDPFPDVVCFNVMVARACLSLAGTTRSADSCAIMRVINGRGAARREEGRHRGQMVDQWPARIGSCSGIGERRASR